MSSIPLSARERKISKVSDSWIRIDVKKHDNLHHIDFNKEKIQYRKAEMENKDKDKDKKDVKIQKMPILSANRDNRRIKTANRATMSKDLISQS